MATKPAEKAVKAQQDLAKSAGKLAQSADTQEESADRRTQLAADRTLLASERTYAAWVRTGLAALAAGIGAKALLADLITGWLVLITSIVLILFAEFCFIAGVWRQLIRAVPPPRPDTPALPEWLLITFNTFLLLLGAAVLVGLVTH